MKSSEIQVLIYSRPVPLLNIFPSVLIVLYFIVLYYCLSLARWEKVVIGISVPAVVITLVVFGIRGRRPKGRKYEQPKPVQTGPSEKDKGPYDYTSSYNQRCSAKPKDAFYDVCA